MSHTDLENNASSIDGIFSAEGVGELIADALHFLLEQLLRRWTK